MVEEHFRKQKQEVFGKVVLAVAVSTLAVRVSEYIGLECNVVLTAGGRYSW